MTNKKSSKPTRRDLETKINDLEKKLEQLSSMLESKSVPKPSAQTPPKPSAQTPPKPSAQTPPKPSAQTPPKPSAQTPPKSTTSTKPKSVEKPSPPAPKNNAEALEVVLKNWPTTNHFDYKAKTPGYSPNANRYYARLHAERGTASTFDWNMQKAKVTGYTAPSNQYFATKQRLAWHPADKRFNGFDLKLDGVVASSVQTQQASPPPKPDATLPKDIHKTSPSANTMRKDDLVTYEADYLKRLEEAQKEKRELEIAATELMAKKHTTSQSRPSSSRGSLPKGF